jgi:hypothetical protein
VVFVEGLLVSMPSSIDRRSTAAAAAAAAAAYYYY